VEEPAAGVGMDGLARAAGPPGPHVGLRLDLADGMRELVVLVVLSLAVGLSADNTVELLFLDLGARHFRDDVRVVGCMKVLCIGLLLE